ncbi:MAG: hypothetical protein ACRCZW_01130 [Lactobacillaceae bacterium]
MTKSNRVNIIRTIGEHTISMINYYVGLLKLEPEEHCGKVYHIISFICLFPEKTDLVSVIIC